MRFNRQRRADGTPNGSYRAHALHAPDNAWYEIQDLIVQEVLPQQVTLAETFIQIYEQRREERGAFTVAVGVVINSHAKNSIHY